MKYEKYYEQFGGAARRRAKAWKSQTKLMQNCYPRTQKRGVVQLRNNSNQMLVCTGRNLLNHLSFILPSFPGNPGYANQTGAEVKGKTCKVINWGNEGFAGVGIVSSYIYYTICATVSPGYFCMRVNKISAPLHLAAFCCTFLHMSGKYLRANLASVFGRLVKLGKLRPNSNISNRA